MSNSSALPSNVTFLIILLFTFFTIAVFVIFIFSLWRVYKKAGKPGWAAFIPIYNFYVLLKIVERPGWWLLLLFVPFVNIVIDLVVSIDLANKFGKSTLFGIIFLWMLPLIGFIILGDGKSQYLATKSQIIDTPPSGSSRQPAIPPVQATK